MLYPVILAGGLGTRLWPVSNQNNPKQFKALLSDKTLLQNTYDRVASSFDKKNIFVVSCQNIVDNIRQQIDILPENILIEPQAKGTAIAIALATLKIKNIDPQAIIVTVNSDHFIKNEKEYTKALKKAEKVVEKNPDKMLLFGVKPAYPETGYGYIETKGSKGDIYEVASLKEKPDLATAKAYVKSGKFLWSPGIFVFKAASLIDWYKKYLPGQYQALLRIEKSPDNIAKEYEKIQNISIDYGLLEKMDNMLVMPINFTWADVGHWRSLRDILLDGKDNVTNTSSVTVDSKNNLLYSFSGKLVATVGVENMVLVETEDVIFLCPADRAQDVKKLLEQIKNNGLEKYL
ncbi:mannose-1-phosphate guanylyltransferase [Patescibacteria group bacterium]|nr:mannose-1-phosphate guanylyltransferase [Patescibacteria group bacterium]